MRNLLLKGRGIVHSYHEGKIDTPVLRGIDIDIEAAKMTAIVGKSGSGKSTLLHILGTLDTPKLGHIWFGDEDITKLSPNAQAQFRNRHLGFVYQFHHLLADFTALENVMLPLLMDNVKRSLAENRAYHLLEQIGLKEVAHHLPSELSGGERQRVAIARAVVYSPELILADEPTGNLDEANAALVFSLFKELVRDEQAAVVMVTHDMSLAQQCDNIYTIVDGTISNGILSESEANGVPGATRGPGATAVPGDVSPLGAAVSAVTKPQSLGATTNLPQASSGVGVGGSKAGAGVAFNGAATLPNSATITHSATTPLNSHAAPLNNHAAMLNGAATVSPSTITLKNPVLTEQDDLAQRFAQLSQDAANLTMDVPVAPPAEAPVSASVSASAAGASVTALAPTSAAGAVGAAVASAASAAGTSSVAAGIGGESQGGVRDHER